MGRRPYKSSGEKMQVILSVLKGEMTQVEAARRLEMSQTTVAKWQKQFLDGAREALSRGEIRNRYDCVSGLSDHSGTIFPALAATALGGRVVEIHVTLSREMFGPDVAASITTRELRTLVEGVRYLETAMAAPVDKDAAAIEMAPMRALFGRSLVARRALPSGHVLTADDLTAKKPGDGLPPVRLEAVVGRRLRRSLDVDQPLTTAHVEPASGAAERDGTNIVPGSR